MTKTQKKTGPGICKDPHVWRPNRRWEVTTPEEGDVINPQIRDFTPWTNEKIRGKQGLLRLVEGSTRIGEMAQAPLWRPAHCGARAQILYLASGNLALKEVDNPVSEVVKIG